MSIQDDWAVGDDDNKSASGDGGGAVPITGPPVPPRATEIMGVVFALFAAIFALLSLVANLLNAFDRQQDRETVTGLNQTRRNPKAESAKGTRP